MVFMRDRNRNLDLTSFPPAQHTFFPLSQQCLEPFIPTNAHMSRLCNRLKEDVTGSLEIATLLCCLLGCYSDRRIDSKVPTLVEQVDLQPSTSTGPSTSPLT
jgi:hypothetical protein